MRTQLWKATFAALLMACAPALAAEESVRMEPLVVTPNRTEQGLLGLAESVSVVGRDDVRRSPARSVDDLLRTVPGFSLFRRSSGQVAHPTTQGVSLRGVGPTGASRTLVLLDGIPLNDPFGGWVQWNRVPLESLERVEVVRGGGSGVWGNGALGGTIQLLGRRPEPGHAEITAEGGDRGAFRTDAAAGMRTGRADVSVGGGYADSGGYPVVREGQRGPIDTDASSRAGTFRGRAAWAPAGDLELELGGGYFDEERDNGTPLTENSTRIGLVTAGGRLVTDDGSRWESRLFGQLQTFSSTFSAQEADRSRESPALDQFDVPSTAAGASLQWSRRLGKAHDVGAGADFRWVEGETNEDFFFDEGRFHRRRVAGGEQQLAGVFARDLWRALPRLDVTLAARVDLWRSFDGFRRERSLDDGAPLRDEDFSDRDRVAFDPKLGLAYRLTERLSLRGLFYRGFRAPTLNEQVRPFRVRNDVTEANARLDPERLLGGEVGVQYGFESVEARVGGFWNEIDDPIANVTIGPGGGTVAPCGFVPEGGVCRQRQNLEGARVRGIETDFEVRPVTGWMGSVGYLYSDAEITEARAARGLEGKRLAQVPRHQLSTGLSFDRPEILIATLQVRWVGSQFEDDRNRLSLGDFAVLDLFLSRALGRRLEIYVAVENLFDREIEAGRTADGLVSVGAPRLVHGGLRLLGT